MGWGAARVGQTPSSMTFIALAVCAVGGSSICFLFFLPLWETARNRLKYCLKGPLNPQ